MNRLQRFEYVLLRLIRRFVVSEPVARRLSALIPYYRPSANERDPAAIVAAYQQHLQAQGENIAGRRVLEAGSGRTLLVAYALAHAGAAEVLALEPFVAFDRALDEKLLASHPQLAGARTRVRRVQSAQEIPAQSVDVLLSNSVLEHVGDLGRFFADCRRVLAPAGLMLHIVDYRDHFFKYPYAFLTFRRSTWRCWLDPGDLPRWRLYDHVDAMQAAGFEVHVLSTDADSAAFAAIAPQLDAEFTPPRAGLEVTRAVLLARTRAAAP